jgi:hypothetical protein
LDGNKKTRIVFRLDNGTVWPLFEGNKETRLKPVGVDFQGFINNYHEENKGGNDLGKKVSVLEDEVAFLKDKLNQLLLAIEG